MNISSGEFGLRLQNTWGMLLKYYVNYGGGMHWTGAPTFSQDHNAILLGSVTSNPLINSYPEV